MLPTRVTPGRSGRESFFRFAGPAEDRCRGWT
jgi:hypothetical protein